MTGNKMCRGFAIVGEVHLLAIVKREQLGRQRRPLLAPSGADFAKRLDVP